MIQQLNVQRAVISVAGITERGIFNLNLLLVETEKAMMQAADEVTVVADSTKFNKSSLALLCELSMIDSIVVDDELETEWVNTLQLAGIEVHVAAIRTETISTT
jgi:DeoR/GlpR family transcriptional regulator of sugar metabolism